MKKLILLTLFLGIGSYLMAQIHLKGSLSGNYNNNYTTPDYIVDSGDIYILNGNSVTIGSNVTIRFDNNGTTGYKFDVQAGGTLTANGNNGLIEFYPSSTTSG